MLLMQSFIIAFILLLLAKKFCFTWIFLTVTISSKQQVTTKARRCNIVGALLSLVNYIVTLLSIYVLNLVFIHTCY